MNEVDVVVVGAGLAGLMCAATLQRRGLDVRLLEAGDTVGGRCAPTSSTVTSATSASSCSTRPTPR